MSTTRVLPSRRNELMTKEAPSYETLVARRRLGQTDLSVKAGQVGTSNSTKPKLLGTFDYAHLRAPLPKGITSGIFHPSPASYFLMRRSEDGFISATGMFKATFPYAELAEEDAERKYIKSLETTSTEETAGNVWISPEHALELAKEYEISVWIEALLDNTPVDAGTVGGSTPKPTAISPPPTFLMPQDALSQPTPSRTSRSRRSASPSKIASPRKTAGSTRSRRAKAGSVEPPATTNGTKLEQSLETPTEEESTEAASSTPEAKASEPREAAVVRVNVDTDVVVEGDVETTHTHVEVEMPANMPELPLPEDTEAMIAKAKEMVEAAVKGQQEANATAAKQLKRKADEVEPDSEEETALVVSKRAKTEIVELKKERVKTKALFGITATFVFGAAIQYAFSVL